MRKEARGALGWTLVLLWGSSPAHAATYGNKDYGDICNPYEQVTDGAFYCTDQFDGWWSGGAGSARVKETQCYRPDRGECRCPDCGDTWTQCLQTRCDDAVGVIDPKLGCVQVRADTSTLQLPPKTYNYCYKTKMECNHQMCRGDQYLKGCMRAVPGVCTDCTGPKAGYYFGGVFVCVCAFKEREALEALTLHLFLPQGPVARGARRRHAEFAGMGPGRVRRVSGPRMPFAPRAPTSRGCTSPRMWTVG